MISQKERRGIVVLVVVVLLCMAMALSVRTCSSVDDQTDTDSLNIEIVDTLDMASESSQAHGQRRKNHKRKNGKSRNGKSTAPTIPTRDFLNDTIPLSKP